MKRRFSLLLVAGLLAAAFLLPQHGWAHGVSVGLSIGVPAPAVVYGAPAYYVPTYYPYYPGPVYGPTVVVGPRYGYYDRFHHWHPRHYHRAPHYRGPWR